MPYSLITKGYCPLLDILMVVPADIKSVNWPVTYLSIHQNHNNLWDNGVFPKCFSLNSANSVTKKIYDIKRIRTCHLATSSIRDQHATIAPARHMWENGSFNWAQFMLQWFIRFPEFSEFSESCAPFRKNSIGGHSLMIMRHMSTKANNALCHLRVKFKS